MALSTSGSQALPPPHEFTFYCEARHDELPPAGVAEQAPQQGAAGPPSPAGQLVASHAGLLGAGDGLVSKWRQKERLKTTAVALVMCLNIGGPAAVLPARAQGLGCAMLRRAALLAVQHTPAAASALTTQAWTRRT